MAQCPLCLAPVSDDFGLIECAKCNAQLIVHMDGRVEYSGANVSEPITESEPTRAPSAPSFDAIGDLGTQAVAAEVFEFGEPPREFDLESVAQEPTVHATSADFSSEEPAFVEPPPLPTLNEVHEPAEAYDFTTDSADAATEMYSTHPPPAATSASPDLSDIASFGNSDATSSGEGSLRYNLFVRGIDTADVREAFREAITDRKMMWDVDQILRTIRNGEVRIGNVSAVKAYIIISRLRNLPVHIRWEQYGIAHV